MPRSPRRDSRTIRAAEEASPPTPVARRVGRTGSKRQREREEARGRILNAATRLFAAHGLGGVAYGEVARESGLSRPLVYFYFPDLRTLFLEAVLPAMQALHARVKIAAEGEGTGLERITAIGRAYVAFQKEDPNRFYLTLQTTEVHRAPMGTGPLEQAITAEERALMGLVEKVLSRGVADGSVHPDFGGSLPVALSLWAFVFGLVQLGSCQRDTIEQLYGVKIDRFLNTGFTVLQGVLARRR